MPRNAGQLGRYAGVTIAGQLWPYTVLLRAAHYQPPIAGRLSAILNPSRPSRERAPFACPLFPSSASTTMITVDSLRARAVRLQELNVGLAEKVARWKGAESPLLDADRQAYLRCIQAGITRL